MTSLRSFARRIDSANTASMLCGVLLFFSAILSVFDYFIVDSFFNNARVATFSETQGEITAVRIMPLADETTVTYRYQVNGKNYVGKRYRYGMTKKEDFTTLRKGSKTAVYYDPKNPADAVIDCGIRSGELYLLLFMTPFNLTVFGGWRIIWLYVRMRRAARKGSKSDLSDHETSTIDAHAIDDSTFSPLRVIDEGDRLRVRLKDESPLFQAGATLVGMSLILACAMPFVTDMKISREEMLVVWSIALAFSFFAYVRCAVALRTGSRDLIVDAFAKTIVLPASHGRKEPQSLAISQFAAAGVEEEPISKRANSETSREDDYKYLVVLDYKDETTPSETVAEFDLLKDAQALEEWIDDRLSELR